MLYHKMLLTPNIVVYLRGMGICTTKGQYEDQEQDGRMSSGKMR